MRLSTILGLAVKSEFMSVRASRRTDDGQLHEHISHQRVAWPWFRPIEQDYMRCCVLSKYCWGYNLNAHIVVIIHHVVLFKVPLKGFYIQELLTISPCSPSKLSSSPSIDMWIKSIIKVLCEPNAVVHVSPLSKNGTNFYYQPNIVWLFSLEQRLANIIALIQLQKYLTLSQQSMFPTHQSNVACSVKERIKET